VEGRAPDKKNAYFSPNVTWLLVVFVGVALLVVGLTICSDEKYYETQSNGADSLSNKIISDSISHATDNTMNKNSVDSLNWMTMTAGLGRVNNSDKFLMIYFTSEDCEPCRKMETVTFSDNFTRLRLKGLVIPVKIDPASNRSFEYSGRLISESKAADIFSVPGYPALLFYDGQSQEYLFVHPGFVTPATLQKIFTYLEQRIFEDKSISVMDYLQLQSSLK